MTGSESCNARCTGRPRPIPNDGSTRCDKVYRRDGLQRAWTQVRANRGAAGIDQTTIADVEHYGVDRLLDELAKKLKAGTWRPPPARRVFITEARLVGAQAVVDPRGR